MPFPLAHPAAVLPLRRLCPRFLSFAALMIGSIAPDTAYSIDDLNKFSDTVKFLFGDTANNLECVKQTWDWDDFSHTFAGSFGFCLPIGLVMFAIFLALRSGVVAILPNPHRDALRLSCEQGAKPAFLSVAVSMLVGIWLHGGWDQFTNGDRWSGSHWTFLHYHFMKLGSTRLEVVNLIWWCSSLGGMAALLTAYFRFLKARQVPLWVFNREEARYYRLWLALGLIAAVVATPLTLRFVDPRQSLGDLFDFLHRFSGYFLAGLCTLIAFTALFKKFRPLPSPKK